MKLKILTIILIAVTLAGCGSNPVDEVNLTQEFESALETAIIQTMTASAPQFTATSEQVITATEEAAPEIQPSIEPTATITPRPTQTMVVVEATATALPTPCYRAELVEETVPDGTTIPAGQWFSKIWVVRNTGVCEWTKNFRWVLVDGEDFSAETNLPLNQTVLPGEEIRILMELKAPLITGNFRGTYQILTEDGASVTPSGFWVLIAVQ